MTDIQNEDTEALTSLGLTMLQATVYLHLVETENATIKDIAKNTAIARQDLYRITSELQNYGLVEQIITKPIMYKAIPLTTGVNILLQEQQKKTNQAHKKAKQLLQRYKTKEVTTQTKTEKSQYILVPGKNALILKEKEMLNNTQKTISFITSKQRFTQKLYSLGEEIKAAIARGATINFLMENNNTKKNTEPTDKLTKKHKEHPNFKIKYTHNPPPVVMSIRDKKEAIIVSSANASLTESPALWSNNPSLIELAHNYFTITWTTSTKNNITPPQKTSKTHPTTKPK